MRESVNGDLILVGTTITGRFNPKRNENAAGKKQKAFSQKQKNIKREKVVKKQEAFFYSNEKKKDIRQEAAMEAGS